jgi:hypothetical protein
MPMLNLQLLRSCLGVGVLRFGSLPLELSCRRLLYPSTVIASLATMLYVRQHPMFLGLGGLDLISVTLVLDCRAFQLLKTCRPQ